jgi:hypothetical protein
MAQRWAMHSPLCPGGIGKVSPLPQHCTLPAHEEATLPCVSFCDGHLCCRRCLSHCDCLCHLHRRCHCRRCWPSPLPLPLAIAIAVAVSVAIAVAIAITVGHRCHHCRWPLPSLSPLPLPFKQFKQLMLA